MNIKKVIVILSFLIMIRTVLADANIYNIFCDVRFQNITPITTLRHIITEPKYIFQVNNCYGYFYHDYSCKIENLNERYKWQNYTLISDKEFVTQNLTLNTDYRIQTSDWSGSIDSKIEIVSDTRDLQILAKEACSKTLGRDYSGRFNSLLGGILFVLFTFGLSTLLWYILPIIVILLLFWIIYKKFKSKKK